MMDVLRGVSIWFLIFMTYSFLGWVMEMFVTLQSHRKFYNRGFLIGPLCPIYGVGGTLVTMLIGQQEGILEIFCTVVILGAIIEYSTSFLMEKLFHARWWDYSNRPFNLNGRICLEALMGFGILGTIAVKIVGPFLIGSFRRIDSPMLLAIAGVLILILIVDFITSLRLIIRFRTTTKVAHRGDITEDVTKYIRAEFSEHGKLSRRLLRAFPAMEVREPAKNPRKSRKKSD